MTYFNFNYSNTTDNVDVVNDINVNLDAIDVNLNPLQFNNSTYTGISEGFESHQSDRMAVWNGTDWRFSESIPLAWGAWTVLPLAGVVERASWTPKFRVNTTTKQVQLTGGVHYDDLKSAWPSSYVTISGGVTGVGIDKQYMPVNGLSIQNTAASAGTTDGEFSTGYAYIYEYDATSPVGIDLVYLGDAGGGNFIMLDGIKWWYG